MKKKYKIQDLDLSDLGNNWVRGVYRDCWFEAKVYELGSEFGINSGCVSKLIVKRDEKVIFNYDRGKDIDHKIGYEIAAIFDQNKKG